MLEPLEPQLLDLFLRLLGELVKLWARGGWGLRMALKSLFWLLVVAKAGS